MINLKKSVLPAIIAILFIIANVSATTPKKETNQKGDPIEEIFEPLRMLKDKDLSEALIQFVKTVDREKSRALQLRHGKGDVAEYMIFFKRIYGEGNRENALVGKCFSSAALDKGLIEGEASDLYTSQVLTLVTTMLKDNGYKQADYALWLTLKSLDEYHVITGNGMWDGGLRPELHSFGRLSESKRRAKKYMNIFPRIIGDVSATANYASLNAKIKSEALSQIARMYTIQTPSTAKDKAIAVYQGQIRKIMSAIGSENPYQWTYKPEHYSDKIDQTEKEQLEKLEGVITALEYCYIQAEGVYRELQAQSAGSLTYSLPASPLSIRGKDNTYNNKFKGNEISDANHTKKEK